jgi:hypothetical protein
MADKVFSSDSNSSSRGVSSSSVSSRDTGSKGSGSDTSNSGGSVIRFRPRGASASGWGWPLQRPRPADPPVADLSKFEQTAGEDDYRHRMTMNALALMVTTVLVIVGLWLAFSIAEMVKNQDCFLQGRRNCETIVVPRTE